ncbi:MAG: dicarboxylate/amino acid:cation symporter [Eggerthellaceae bacterium]
MSDTTLHHEEGQRSEAAATKPGTSVSRLLPGFYSACSRRAVRLWVASNPDFADTYTPIGTVFLNLIKMIVVPLVVFSIMTGIISLQDIKKVGAIGGKTVAFYMITTAFAVVIGLLFANVLHVGGGYTLPASELTYEAKESPSFIDTLVNIFPSNFFQPMADATMLQIIVIALVFGFGIIAAAEEGGARRSLVGA